MRPTLVLLAVVLTSACSSSGPARQADTALNQALRRVNDTAAARRSVEFGRPSAIVAANHGFDPSGPYAPALMVGASQLLLHHQSLSEHLGIDPTKATVALTVGVLPRTGTLLTGLPLAGVGRRLNDLGATRTATGSTVTYRFRPDYQVSLDDELSKAALGVSSELNVVDIDGDDLRTGPSQTDAAQFRASGDGLLHDRSYREVANCLGDPLAAILTTDGTLVRPSPSAGVELIGVGVAGRTGELATEELCIRSTASKALATKVRDALRSGQSKTLAPWSELLTGARVSVEGDVVRVTAHPLHRPGGVLLTALDTGDVPGLT